MRFIQAIIFKIFLFYFKYFPIERGKEFISRIITALIGEVNVKTKNEVWLRILPSSSMDKSYFDRGNESHKIIEQEINKLQNGEIFVDIGSNIGYFTFLASQKVGNTGLVYSFEPSNREYIRLITGEKLNKSLNIISLNCAISDKNEMCEFIISDFHTGLNQLNTRQNKSMHNLLVYAFRADYIINQPTIHLVKIDVEGAELKVIKGLEGLLKERKIKKLIVEITPDFLEKFGNSKEELYLYLTQHHFTPIVLSNNWQYDEIFILDELD